MLSLTRVSSGQASTYYQADDYYLQEHGEWQGELAAKLGYEGAIKEEDFQTLIKGQNEKNNINIQSGGKDYSHTAGVDLTFSAPKSVSIAGLVLDDKRVLEAHDKAISSTLAYIEKNYTNVRIKKDKMVTSEATGNMLAAKFQHVSSREQDPQLHTHCLVMNFTQKENGDIRAMDFREVYDKMFLGQIYRSELASNLKDIGYQIQSDDKGLFEIKGFESKLIEEFSKRSQQIKMRMVELKEQHPNASNSKLREIATLETRQSKQESNIKDLQQEWSQRLNEYNYNKKEVIEQLTQQEHKTQNPDKVTKEFTKEANTAADIIKYAINIATEHEAVAKNEDVLRIATKLSVGEFRISDLENAFINDKDIVKLDNMCTTKSIIAMEHKIVADVENGKNALTAINTAEQVNRGINEYEIDHRFNLTNGQKESVAHILTSPDKVIAIQGDAGTGKTTMLDVVRTITEKDKVEVIGLSFTGKAASEIEEASKIPSRTIASFLNTAPESSPLSKVMVVDEASMLSIKDMNALLKRCDDNTKLVLIGDTKQLQTIGQGKIFSSLQEKQAINVVRMSEVQRQTDADYKNIVDKIGAKQVAEAFKKLDSKGKINEVADRGERLEAIVADYMKNARSTIIVTAVNKDREELNRLIRSEMIDSGKVKYGDKDVLTREVKSIIGENKSFAQSYMKGDIIVINSAGVIGKAGLETIVTAVDQHNHILQLHSKGQTYDLDLKQHGQELQVYTEQLKGFAQGDKIIFLKNDNGLNVKNGQTGVVKSINKDGKFTVMLDNKKEVSFNSKTQYNYISHGYALTDYKSQGQTAKHVIYHADTNKVTNYNQAYVAITRGKQSVKIYTDDKVALTAKVKEEQNKTTTLDYGLDKKGEDLKDKLYENNRKKLTTENIITHSKVNLNKNHER
jgi:conjugative relaxase-like TrwC/TraI family protein